MQEIGSGWLLWQSSRAYGRFAASSCDCCWPNPDGPALNLQRNMITGQATPVMLRDAVRRLANMLEISGEVGDYRTEAKIIRPLTNLTMAAQQTIYS